MPIRHQTYEGELFINAISSSFINNKKNKMTRCAFIDSENLKRAVEAIGKEIDYKRFRLWLTNKLNVDRAIMYFGYIEDGDAHYKFIRKCGFETVFRQVERMHGHRKANIDICLTISVLDQMETFDDAYLISSDGDFFDLTERLQSLGKLAGIISPASPGKCSRLLRSTYSDKIFFIPNVIHKFENR